MWCSASRELRRGACAETSGHLLRVGLAGNPIPVTIEAVRVIAVTFKIAHRYFIAVHVVGIRGDTSFLRIIGRAAAVILRHFVRWRRRLRFTFAVVI